jgi:hypothetical protein
VVRIRGTREVPTDQAWSWSPEWQALEREADEAGPVGTVMSGEEFLAELDRVDADLRTQGR